MNDFTNGDPLAVVTPGISFHTTGTTGGADAWIVVGDSHGDTYTRSNSQILASGGSGTTAFSAVPISFSNLTSESVHLGSTPAEFRR